MANGELRDLNKDELIGEVRRRDHKINILRQKLSNEENTTAELYAQLQMIQEEVDVDLQEVEDGS